MGDGENKSREGKDRPARYGQGLLLGQERAPEMGRVGEHMCNAVGVAAGDGHEPEEEEE